MPIVREERDGGMPTGAGGDVSVVICAFASERWRWIVAAVESVREQTVAARETIVVIDHNDFLLNRVKTELDGVVVLPNSGERGAGGARNTGAAAASGSIVAFLDDDARAETTWIEHLLEPLRTASILGVGGEVIPEWQSARPAWFPPEFDWVIGCSYRGLPETPTPIRNLMAGNMALRRAAFLELGGYRSGHGNVQISAGDSALGRGRRFVTRQSGCEETEFCIRGLQRWPESVWLYKPEMRIHHWVPDTRLRWQYFFARCYDEGLAKATVVVRYSGGKVGLSTERSYVLNTLMRGMVHGVGDFLRGDHWGLARAAAIATGATVTLAGYIRGRASVVLSDAA